ncbi:hypothetical protein JOQ06_018040, partial [Pogonophryne albipinna]
RQRYFGQEVQTFHLAVRKRSKQLDPYIKKGQQAVIEPASQQAAVGVKTEQIQDQQNRRNSAALYHRGWERTDR